MFLRPRQIFSFCNHLVIMQIVHIHNIHIIKYVFLLNLLYIGWHNRLNSKAQNNSQSFYKLVPLLLLEADTVKRSIVAGDLDREVNKRYTDLDNKLQETWESYIHNDISTFAFLRTVGRLYRPALL